MEQRHPLAVWLLMTCGFLFLVPIAAGGLKHIGDERFYTDAAIRMVQHGDYLTPYSLDGSLHFNKPILTYWAVLASFTVFGISSFASRLPSLLAGCALLWLTERCAFSLFQRRDAALLAAGVLLANPIFYVSSIHATPDVFLTLFLLASLYGFSRILFEGDRSRRSYLLAYLGAALAVETKGLSGLLPILYAYAFCAASRRGTTRMRDLFEPKSVALATVVASAWFVSASLRHGAAVWSDFFGDQITGPVQGKPFHPLSSAWFYLNAAVQHFLPWVLLVALQATVDRAGVVRFLRERRRACLFVVGWYGLLLIPFCVPGILRGRYLLPAYPLLSMTFAAVLMHGIREGRSARLVRRAAQLLIGAAAGAGALLLAAGARIDARLAAAGLVVLAANTALLFAVSKREPHAAPLLVAVSLFLLVTTSDTAISSVFAPRPEPALVRELMEHGVQEGEVATLGLDEHAASLVALWSAGRLVAKPLPDDVTWSELAKHPVLFLSAAARERWPFEGYRLAQCGYEYEDWRSSDVRALLSTRGVDGALARRRRSYYLARRVTGP